MSLRARICHEICTRPGITQLEIARSIYGSTAYQNLVANVCRQLVREGYVSRRGIGGRHDPFTFTWIQKQANHDFDRASCQQRQSNR